MKKDIKSANRQKNLTFYLPQLKLLQIISIVARQQKLEFLEKPGDVAVYRVSDKLFRTEDNATHCSGDKRKW